ncbi:hypothetical protein GF359_02050 [candidate division WOR-3 bacterium]|uniref:Uncharacterized protein n=1 Tax=candidate division WOR-3 bacterium TaxID=2052148 RepID=A0A9D5K824_UNCW3|nr:hypothetical protein [candidate division WOR-3 bacterium]MBD3363977.1 hypothetical protein [candidate division WOR-3 bacterium]
MRYVSLMGLAAVLLLSCGMSEEEFKGKIGRDVAELCLQDYTAGFNYIMTNGQINGSEPEPKRIPELIDTYKENVFKSEDKIGQYQLINDAVNEYPRNRQTQAATILIRSAAYSSAYGQYLALHMYQSLGDSASALSVEDTFRRDFMRTFFMPKVFDKIYASAVPDSNSLDPEEAFSQELLTDYSKWYMGWLAEE